MLLPACGFQDCVEVPRSWRRGPDQQFEINFFAMHRRPTGIRLPQGLLDQLDETKGDQNAWM